MVRSLPRLIAPTLEVFDFGDIPDSKFVLTTWNEYELLQGTFWFAKQAAYHPTGKLGYNWVTTGLQLVSPRQALRV